MGGTAGLRCGWEKGDLKSKQFWVEKNRLLFVRLFEPIQGDVSKFQDIRFEDYREMAGGWVAARVEVYVDDKKVFSEEFRISNAMRSLIRAHLIPSNSTRLIGKSLETAELLPATIALMRNPLLGAALFIGMGILMLGTAVASAQGKDAPVKEEPPDVPDSIQAPTGEEVVCSHMRPDRRSSAARPTASSVGRSKRPRRSFTIGKTK